MIDRKRRTLAFALPASLASVLARPVRAAAPGKPFSVVDDRGAMLRFEAAPSRLAAISYFGADTALALGVQPVASTFLVRGRRPAYLLDRMDRVIDLGQRASPNLELLASAHADLIIAIRRYTEANAARLQQIAPYLALDLEVGEDSNRSIELVGKALDRAEAAAALNRRFAEALAGFRARAGLGRAPRYLFVWGTGAAPWAFYDENMTCSLLNALGGVNIAGRNPLPSQRDNTAFQMSLETLLLAKPDTIFVYDDGGRRSFETNPVWQHLASTRRVSIVSVGDHWIESFGPIARHAVLAEAAALLHPDVFAPPDLRAIASSYLDRVT
ncbi:MULTISPECIES: ABC transporter substrate-binding protein [Burkholderia]|uniref:Ferrichrome ABC transporter substrate-binding protein n=1 Tax=Burkholderia mayonis TaxID=1385591 RepID=A0A1B4FJE1_9BURK|nr:MULTISPECIES: ABC transporter substrate-binding protein [Burkholderia]AOJ03728.1 ferrichrome ABC transporter substrate-binding protein [Burkholderia mayonis]KVE41567.1 ferrichrome ABC transporter substrate-binding protein [Burkholderia sp. BDU5]KVE46896.1 ferrichrome ABC transporter substrate-binding protein [Burkholderia mayonis]